MTELGTSDVTVRVSVPPSVGLALPTFAWHPGTGVVAGGVVAGSVRRADVVAGEGGGAGGREVADTDAAMTSVDGDGDPSLADLEADVEVDVEPVVRTVFPSLALLPSLVATAADVTVVLLTVLAFFLVEPRSTPMNATRATMSATTENQNPR
jgi:hypothetical protein